MSEKLRPFRRPRAHHGDATPEEQRGERSLALVIAVSAQGLLAVLLALFAAMNAAAMALGDGERGPHAAALVLQGSGAVAVAALAAGLLFLRRWAVDLSLAVSRVALLAGVNGMALEVAAAPGLMTRLEHAPTVVHPHLTLAVLLAAVALLFVVLPFGFLLFYRRPALATAFRRADPESRWTDRQPAAILLLLVALVACAALAAALAVAAAAVGRWRGSLVPLAAAAALAVLAWGVLRRRRWTWAATVALSLAALIAAIALAARPAVGAELARESAAGQGAAARFYLARFFAPWYQIWLAFELMILLLAVWRLRGHFRRSLEIVARGAGGAR